MGISPINNYHLYTREPTNIGYKTGSVSDVETFSVSKLRFRLVGVCVFQVSHMNKPAS